MRAFMVVALVGLVLGAQIDAQLLSTQFQVSAGDWQELRRELQPYLVLTSPVSDAQTPITIPYDQSLRPGSHPYPCCAVGSRMPSSMPGGC